MLVKLLWCTGQILAIIVQLPMSVVVDWLKQGSPESAGAQGGVCSTDKPAEVGSGSSSAFGNTWFNFTEKEPLMLAEFSAPLVYWRERHV